MLCCVALCCVVLCCVGLCCVALHCVVLGCVALCCVAFHCIVLCCVVLCWVVLHCIVLHCVVLCCVASRCVGLCCVALHCVVLCSVRSVHKQPQNLLCSAQSVKSTCGQTYFPYFQLLNQQPITCGTKNTEMKLLYIWVLHITFCCNLWMCKQLGKLFLTQRNRGCNCSVIRWVAANTATVRRAFKMLGTTHWVTECHLNPQ